MTRSYRPNDPLLSSQWHLFQIGRLGFSQAADVSGLERVWADYRGGGVSVGIWDDGVQKTHWDLAANYDDSRQVTVEGTLNLGQPMVAADSHGTAVAGLIAADDNGRGGVGVAFDARITGVKIFGGADDINTAWTRYLETLDNLGRFDVTNHSYGSPPDFIVYGDTAKFEASLVTGRGGLGTINVKSAGNHDTDGNGTAADASRATVTVAALTSDGQVASYSAYGAHVLVSAAAGSVTTDRLGTAGYNTASSGDYTTGFGGTSASAPVVTGVVALMLDANARLGWRDVQNILAYSAQGTGSLVTGNTEFEDSSWRQNGADNWNGGGLHFSNDYGFGMVNAHAAVRMAEVWTMMQGGAAVSGNEARATSGTLAVNAQILSNETLRYTFNVSGRIELEHVGLTLNLTHSDMTDLRITLVSPQGTEITVFDGSSARAGTAASGLTYTFGLEGFRGELSNGVWTLRISDVVAGDDGVLKSVGFTGYGASETVNDVYHYTDEVLAALERSGGAARLVLADADGGTDWIDAAPMWKDLNLDLRAGATSTLGGTAFLQIAAGSVIENAAGGDGNDTIIGNDADNVLAGMRGDDRLEGGAGSDTARFFGNAADYQMVDMGGWITVTSLQGGYGVDVLVGIEFARFNDGVVDLTTAFGDLQAPRVAAMLPAGQTQFAELDADIVLRFDEAVQAGSGSFQIVGSDGSVLTFAADDSQVTVAGQTVTINPVDMLAAGVRYQVIVGADAVEDLSGNQSAAWGLSGEGAFTTRPEGLSWMGGAGADYLRGTTGTDVMEGLGGADTLSAGAGNDVLQGGTGADLMIGGAGDDVYYIDSAKDMVTEAVAGGIDTVRTLLASLTLAPNAEALVYEGSGAFSGWGNALDNGLAGGAGDDRLAGRGGADTLLGGGGDDRLTGGAGADVLTGGAGADVFIFNARTDSSVAAPDTITDFERGADRISLAKMDADTTLASRQAFSSALVTAFDGTAGQLKMTLVDGGVMVEGDVNGDGLADFALRVLGPSVLLAAEDFIF